MPKRSKIVTAELIEPATLEIRERARMAGPEAIAALLNLMRGADSESVRLAAIKELLDRGFGRPAAAPNEGTGGVIAHLVIDDGYPN